MVEGIGGEHGKQIPQKGIPTHHVSDRNVANFEETFSNVQKSFFASLVHASHGTKKSHLNKKNRKELEEMDEFIEESEEDRVTISPKAIRKVEKNIELIYNENPEIARELNHIVKKKIKTLEEIQREIKEETQKENEKKENDS